MKNDPTEELYEKLRHPEKLSRPDFWDKCHKFNWAISLVGTLVIQFLFWAVMAGEFKQKVDDMKEYFGSRIERLEHQMDSLLEKQKS